MERGAPPGGGTGAPGQRLSRGAELRRDSALGGGRRGPLWRLRGYPRSIWRGREHLVDADAHLSRHDQPRLFWLLGRLDAARVESAWQWVHLGKELPPAPQASANQAASTVCGLIVKAASYKSRPELPIWLWRRTTCTGSRPTSGCSRATSPPDERQLGAGQTGLAAVLGLGGRRRGSASGAREVGYRPKRPLTGERAGDLVDAIRS